MDGSQNSTDPSGAGEAPGLMSRIGSKANVSTPERWVSAAAGGALIYFGLRRRSWPGALMALIGANLVFRGSLGRSLIYRLLGIDTTESGKKILGAGTFKVEKSISADRPPTEVYRFWRNFENLPRIMKHLRSVRSIDDRRSHWVVKAPLGLDIEWDAEITEDYENGKIVWRSLDSSSGIWHTGAVIFEPIHDGRGTDIRVYMEYYLPEGKAGKAFAKLIGKDPDRMVEEDLRRFKRLIEKGAREFVQARG